MGHNKVAGHPQSAVAQIDEHAKTLERIFERAMLAKPVSRKELPAALHDIFQERRGLNKSQSA